MEYRSKYKAEEIEAILDAQNNDGAGVDANLDGLFTDALQTKEVEVSEDTTIKADEGFLGLKEVSVKVSGGGSGGSNIEYLDVSGSYAEQAAMCSNIVKIVLNGNTIIGPYVIAQQGLSDGWGSKAETYIGIIKDTISVSSLPIQNGEEMIAFLEEQAGTTFPRITEEEFYTL